MLNALSSATGTSVKVLKDRLVKLGDIGDLAAECRTTQQTMFKPPSLTIQGVYQEFRTMANLTGKMSTKEREKHLQKLLVSASSKEAKYIARIVLGKLRIHIAYKTVIAALATVFAAKHEGASVKEATATLNAVYSQLPVWDRIIPVLIQNKSTVGLEEQCKLTPGVPVGPMLAKPVKVRFVLENCGQGKTLRRKHRMCLKGSKSVGSCVSTNTMECERKYTIYPMEK